VLLDDFGHWHLFISSFNVLVSSRIEVLMGNLGDTGYGSFNYLLYYFLAFWDTHKTEHELRQVGFLL
jgi:hypothetical protein